MYDNYFPEIVVKYTRGLFYSSVIFTRKEKFPCENRSRFMLTLSCWEALLVIFVYSRKLQLAELKPWTLSCQIDAV